MSTDDDQPDRYQGEERTEGVEDILDELGGDTDDEDTSLEDVWESVADSPHPGEDLGYDRQGLKFLPHANRPGVVACCPETESSRFATDYIEINRDVVITDLTDWA